MPSPAGSAARTWPSWRASPDFFLVRRARASGQPARSAGGDPAAPTFIAPPHRSSNATLSSGRRTALVRHDVEAAERDSVVLRALLVPELEAENDRLRRSLGLGHSLGWGFVPAEALHSRALGEEFTITLTRGAQAGVRPFSPVVAPEGLVGMVETVDPTMSLAIIWAHPDFRASALRWPPTAARSGSSARMEMQFQPRSDTLLLELNGVQLQCLHSRPARRS